MSVSRHYATVILSLTPKPWVETHGYSRDRRYATQNLPGGVNQPGRFFYFPTLGNRTAYFSDCRKTFV